MTATVIDLHEPYRKSLRAHLPNAVAVAEPFHVVGVAVRVLDRGPSPGAARHLGHRAAKATCYRSRKLLALGEERLDPDSRAKLPPCWAPVTPTVRRIACRTHCFRWLRTTELGMGVTGIRTRDRVPWR